MRPTHPVDLIVAGIVRQEGERQTHHLNNPGNLRFANQLNAKRPDGYVGPLRKDEPVAQFDTWLDGVIALYRQVWAQVAAKETLREMIKQFAPPTENDTATYTANLASWTALVLDTPVAWLIPDIPLIDTPK